MDTPEKESSSPLVPLIVGAAAGAAIAYLFASGSSEGGSKLSDTLNKGWETLKEKAPFIEDEINSFKDRILDTVKANLTTETDQPAGEVREV